VHITFKKKILIQSLWILAWGYMWHSLESTHPLTPVISEG